jgi:putative SOS response-associated peptidase YedK
MVEEYNMCGRFVGFRSLAQLKSFFPIHQAACEVTENFNVAPSQEILVIVKRNRENWLDKFHWGLVPFWAENITVGNRMINARVETVATKPSFRNAFKKRRCLIPADGFYEWQGKKGQKQPMFLKLPDENPFAFAGLWEAWTNKDKTQGPYYSCTILTTAASESVKDIHHRMPVILKPEVYENWIDPDIQDVSRLNKILSDGLFTALVSHPVSKQVNTVHNNDVTNIKPIQMELEF